MFTFLADAAAAAQPAAAPARQAARGGGLMDFVPMVLIVVVMFFIFSRSNKKQQQRRQQMLDSIVKGSKVLLANGIYGTVTEVKDTTFLVEIADKVTVTVNKNGIAGLEDPEAKAEEKK